MKTGGWGSLFVFDCNQHSMLFLEKRRRNMTQIARFYLSFNLTGDRVVQRWPLGSPPFELVGHGTF